MGRSATERPSVVVGMPVRNEEGTIAIALQSVLGAIDVFQRSEPDVAIELLVCFNGCIDRSEAIARTVVEHHPLGGSVRFLTSAPGLLPSLGRMRDAGRGASTFVFFDADVFVAPTCLLRLVQTLDGDPALQVTYARARPLPRSTTRWRNRLLDTPHRHPRLFVHRTFFRGAAYAIRADRLRDPELEPLIGPESVGDASRPGRPRRPITDDVLLSHTVAQRYGLAAIHKERDALIHLTPPGTVVDTFLGMRRLHYELRAVGAWLPAHRRWGRRVFRNRVNWSYLAECGPLVAIELMAYLAARGLLSCLGSIDAALAWHGLPCVPVSVFGKRASTKHLDPQMLSWPADAFES